MTNDTKHRIDPRKLLASRADRLARLVRLEAPDHVVGHEVQMVSEAWILYIQEMNKSKEETEKEALQRSKTSGEERLRELIEQDIEAARRWVEAVGDLVAFGDTDEYRLLLNVPEGDEEARVRGQAHATIWGVYFQVLEDEARKAIKNND